MNSIGEKICVGNDRFSYFRYDVKLDIYYKKIYPVIKKNASVLFIEYTELNWNVTYENGLCVSILFNNMGWYLGVIENPHND